MLLSDYSKSTLANQLPLSEFLSDFSAVHKFNFQVAHSLKKLNAKPIILTQSKMDLAERAFNSEQIPRPETS